PAAYLVDLLQFLKKVQATADSGTTATAFDQLLQRRPDIQLIDLSCDNTNIPLPYVDLVNEILENSPVLNPQNLQYDRQTTLPADVLSVSREHVNRDVYDNILTNAIYPFSLPFDLGTEEARTYLGQLDLSRDAVMRTFQGVNGPSNADIAADALGLTSLERWIVTGAFNPSDWTRRLATATNVGLNQPDAIDGMTLTNGDQVLVKNHTNPAENGLYSYDNIKLSRLPDPAAGPVLRQGVRVLVTAGTQANTQW